ncbi:hypothetical protein EDD85DRAFT_483830 [Armillaria nabsnona]|nr:hypothetical protein EDD85DRAFT_483830 [Armillaria nabsnona]
MFSLSIHSCSAVALFWFFVYQLVCSLDFLHVPAVVFAQVYFSDALKPRQQIVYLLPSSYQCYTGCWLCTTGVVLAFSICATFKEA